MKRNIVIRLEPLDADSTHVEAISVFENGMWSSPAGGWLNGIRGTWLQKPEGVILFSADRPSGMPVGRLLGLSANASVVGSNSTFDFTHPQTVVGRWVLTDFISTNLPDIEEKSTNLGVQSVTEEFLSKKFQEKNANPLIEGDPTFYAYHPKSQLTLGVGFNPSDVTQPKRPGIVFTAKSLDQGAVSVSFRLMYVRSDEELNFALSLDSKIEGAYLGAKASGKSTFATSYELNSTDVTVVMLAKVDFGRWGIDSSATLTADAKALLTDGEKFADTFGSRYVAIERRGALVAAVLKVEHLASALKLDFSSEFSGSGGWGDLSASASGKFTTALKIASKQERLSVDILATGGSGPAALGIAIKNLATADKEPLSAIQKMLGDFLSGFTKENAVPIEYSVASMSHFGWDEGALDPWTDFKEYSLREIATEYRKAKSELDIVESLSDGDHPLCKTLPKDYLAEIIQKKQALIWYVGELAKAHKEYKEFGYLKAGQLPRVVSLILPELIRDINQPPRFKIDIYGLTSIDQVRLVVNTSPNDRRKIAAKFNPIYDDPSVKGPAGMWGFHAIYGFFSIQQVTVFSDGEIQLGAETPYANGTGSIWCWDQGNAEPSLESNLYKWAASGRGSFQATRYYRIKDICGRLFQIAIVEMSWDAPGNGTVVMREFRVLV